MPLLKKARLIEQQVTDRGARLPWTYQTYSVQTSLLRERGLSGRQVDSRSVASACGGAEDSRGDFASR